MGKGVRIRDDEINPVRDILVRGVDNARLRPCGIVLGAFEEKQSTATHQHHTEEGYRSGCNGAAHYDSLPGGHAHKRKKKVLTNLPTQKFADKFGICNR